jgi:hypothetical protein
MTMICSTAANLGIGATLIYLSIICFLFIYLLGWQKNKKELNKRNVTLVVRYSLICSVRFVSPTDMIWIDLVLFGLFCYVRFCLNLSGERKLAIWICLVSVILTSESDQCNTHIWICGEGILTIWIRWGNTHNLNPVREYSQSENLNPVREYSQSEVWNMKSEAESEVWSWIWY